MKFTIGGDITCKDFSLATKRRLYCNGPLKPDTWYEVKMRAFTNGGYSDSLPFQVKTGIIRMQIFYQVYDSFLFYNNAIHFQRQK